MAAERYPRRNLSTSKLVQKTTASLMESSLLAKWLVPSVAVLFAVVGYIVESAHSSFLGGGISSSAGADYAASAADFAYDLPTVAADLLFSCLNLECGKQGGMFLGGHGVPLLMGFLMASGAWWLPRCLKGSLIKWSGYITPLLLIVLLAGKFIWMDAPIVRIENVIVPTNPNDSNDNSKSPPLGFLRESNGELDKFINLQAKKIQENMACSRDPKIIDSSKSPEYCEKYQNRSRQLIEGEFSARILACAMILFLSWKVVQEGRSHWRQAICLLGLITLLTLPYAYGKLLKPTVFEFGRIDLSKELKQLLPASLDSSEQLDAIILARRSNSVDLLIELKGGCPGKDNYLVTKVWSISSSQILSIREILRYDVIEWKLRHRLPGDCGKANSPNENPEKL